MQELTCIIISITSYSHFLHFFSITSEWADLPSYGSSEGPLGCSIPVSGPRDQRGSGDQGEIPIIHDMRGSSCHVRMPSAEYDVMHICTPYLAFSCFFSYLRRDLLLWCGQPAKATLRWCHFCLIMEPIWRLLTRWGDFILIAMELFETDDVVKWIVGRHHVRIFSSILQLRQEFLSFQMTCSSIVFYCVLKGFYVIFIYM